MLQLMAAMRNSGNGRGKTVMYYRDYTPAVLRGAFGEFSRLLVLTKG